VRALASLASLTRPHIVAIAALGTLVFGWLFTARWAPVPALIAGLDWFLVNFVNRAVDAREDRVNRVAGATWAVRHRTAVVLVAAVVILASFAVVQAVEPSLWPLRLAYHLLGLAYNHPLIPVRAGRRVRLKQVYLVKNTASATGFLLTVFGYPLIARPIVVSTAYVIVLAVFFFCVELAYEVFYDLRDVTGDRTARVPTFPVVHGEAAGRAILSGLLATAALSLCIGYATSVLDFKAFILGVGPAVQYAALRRAMRRGRVTEADCTGLTWVGAGLLLAYAGWVAAGLPLDPIAAWFS